MKFTPIDQSSWPRAGLYHYFANMAPTGYAITVQLDVTKLRRILKEAQIRFFPAYLWLITKNLNAQIEFKTALKDGVLGYYDVLTPLYAAFHEDDHTFSLQWTPYCEDFRQFSRAYLENQQQFGQVHGVLSQYPVLPPENAYTVSCIPWVSFTHFSVQSYENKPYYFPSIESGKIMQEADRSFLPLSLTCHHATTDGYHVHCFLETLQQDMDCFKQFL